MTKEVDPFFPLVFKERFHFRRTFKSTNSVFELHDQLGRSIISLELLQIPSASSGCVRLGVFNALLSDILHPYPTCFAKPINTSGLELLFTPCKVFPGIIAPKASVLVSVNIADSAGDSNNKKTSASERQRISAEDKRRQHRVCHTKDYARCNCFKIRPDEKRMTTEMDRNEVKVIRSRPTVGSESAVKPSSSDDRSLEEYQTSSNPPSTDAEEKTAESTRKIPPEAESHTEDPADSNLEQEAMRRLRHSPPRRTRESQDVALKPPNHREQGASKGNNHYYNKIQEAINNCEQQLQLCRTSVHENAGLLRGQRQISAETNNRERENGHPPPHDRKKYVSRIERGPDKLHHVDDGFVSGEDSRNNGKEHHRRARKYKNDCTCLPMLERRDEIAGVTEKFAQKYATHHEPKRNTIQTLSAGQERPKLPTNRRSIGRDLKLQTEPDFDTADEMIRERRLEKNRTRILKSSNRQGQLLDKVTQTSPQQVAKKSGLREIRKPVPMENCPSDSSCENGNSFKREARKGKNEVRSKRDDGNLQNSYRDPCDILDEQLRRDRMYEPRTHQTGSRAGVPISSRNGIEHRNGENEIGDPAESEWIDQKQYLRKDPRFSDDVGDTDGFGDEQCECGRCKAYDSKYKPEAHPCPRYKPQMNRAFKLRNAKINNWPKKVVSSRRPVFNTKKIKSSSRMAPELLSRARRQQNGHAMNCRFVSCINDREIDSYVNKNTAKFYQLPK